MKVEAADQMIEQIKEAIVEHFQPQTIVLFGSHASGHPTLDSDIDLFIVMPSSLRPDKRARQVRSILTPCPVPLDIVVYTPEEVETFGPLKGSFAYEVLQKGRVIYRG